jgi:hypothetical protein
VLNRIERVIVVEAKLWGEPNAKLLRAHLAEKSARGVEAYGFPSAMRMGILPAYLPAY